jgi:site-specific DNA recombinase
MDDVRRMAIFARVSSQAQADEATIQSQVAALQERVAADGGRLEAEMRFLDDGSYYSAAAMNPFRKRHENGLGNRNSDGYQIDSASDV